jgi:hypothetical protein
MRSCKLLFVLILLLPLAARAAAPPPSRWGLNDDSGIRPLLPFGATAFGKAADAGFGWVRYWLYWNTTNPQQGVYDWSSVDAELDNISKSGLEVYMTIMWAPDWAVQGTPGYKPWNCMNAAHPPAFVMNPGCDNRQPDRAAFQTFVREAVRRYAGRVHYWGFWNEPNYAIFWHSVRDPNHPSDPAKLEQNLQDLVSNILIPGYEAAKAENPGIEIAGPETDSLHAMEIILQRDDEYSQRTGHHFLDVITFHQYPPKASLPAGPLTGLWPLVDRFNAAISRFNPPGPGHRPVWLTESHASAATMDEFIQGIAQRTWIDRFSYFGFKTVKCDPADPVCKALWATGPPAASDLLDLLDTSLPGYAAIRKALRDISPR